MEIEQRLEGDVTILTLAHEFDASALPGFSKAVKGVVDGGCRRLLLNVRDIAFVSSSALGYLITAAKHLSEEGGALAISSPRPWLARNLETLDLNTLLHVFPDDEPALNWLRQVV